MGASEAGSLQQKVKYLEGRVGELELIVAACRRFLKSFGKTRFADMVEFKRSGAQLVGMLRQMEGLPPVVEAPRPEPDLRGMLWISLDEILDSEDRPDELTCAAARLVLEDLLAKCPDPGCVACRRLRVVQVVLGTSDNE